MEFIFTSESSYLLLACMLGFDSHCCKFGVQVRTFGCFLPVMLYGVATTSHCLIYSPLVKGVWKQSLFWVHLNKLNTVSFMECAMFVASSLSLDFLELFVIMAWAVWGEFCRRCHVEIGTKRSLSIDWVVSYPETFHNSSRLCSKVAIV